MGGKNITATANRACPSAFLVLTPHQRGPILHDIMPCRPAKDVIPQDMQPNFIRAPPAPALRSSMVSLVSFYSPGDEFVPDPPINLSRLGMG